MPVGNDVVDLRDPETQPGSVHSRFDARVFTVPELELLEAHPRPHRMRWSLWAAKESAFKAARKLDPEIRFIPRDFVVSLVDGVRAEVRHWVGGFQVWFEEARDRVHALATPGEFGGDERRRPRGKVALLDRTGTEVDASRRVRELAREVLAPLASLDPTELRIVAVLGIPEVRMGDRRLPFDLSLSHHGRLVACAWSREG